MANHPRNPKEEARQAFEAAKKVVEEAAKPITPPTRTSSPRCHARLAGAGILVITIISA